MAEKESPRSMAALGDMRVSVNSSPKEAVLFVQRLASDDDFRNAFEADPQGCFAQNHIYIPADIIPENVILPSKEELQDVLASITLGEEFRIGGGSGTGISPVFIAFVAFFAFAAVRAPSSRP